MARRMIWPMYLLPAPLLLLMMAADGRWSLAQPPEATTETPSAEREPANAAEPRADDDQLSVRLEFDESADEPTINFDEPLRFVLTNNSTAPIRVWNPGRRRGHCQFSLHFRNADTGEEHVTRRGDMESDDSWESWEARFEPGTEVLLIAAGESVTAQLILGDGSWTKLPPPNGAGQLSVVARFTSHVTPDDSGQQVWTGEIASAPTLARVIAPRLKTPHDYLRNGFPERAIELMAADPALIEGRDDSQCTPLHHAVRYGHVDAVKWLLKHGADVNAIAYNGFSPLHFADDVAIVRLLLEKRGDSSHPDAPSGETPLQRAVKKLIDATDAPEKEQWARIVLLYQEAGAEYDIVTAIHLDDLARVKVILRKSPEMANRSAHDSPLRLAASLGRADICRYLIHECHVDVDDFEGGNGYPVIMSALEFPEIVKLLIESGADLKTRITWQGGRSGIWIIGDDATILHHAAADGVPETINLLIDQGVDIFAAAHQFRDEGAKQTALEVAAIFGKADNAQAILSHPKFASIAPQDRQLLLDTCLRIGVFPIGSRTDGQASKLVKVLLDAGADPNGSGEDSSPIQIAAGQIHPTHGEENAQIKQTIAVLREHGGKIDLFSAVAIGELETVRHLLDQDPASANARRADGYPALHFAVGMDFQEIIAALLSAGGDVDIRNQSKSTGGIDSTPLHCAAFWGRYEIAKQLLDAGAKIEAATDRGTTPLHEAVDLSNVRLVRLLLEHGANPNRRDKNNETPLDYQRKLHPDFRTAIEKVFAEFQKLSAK
jgi:ankyrin repeat protein